MANVSDLLKYSDQLQSTSDSAQLDCELLLCYVLDVDRTWLRTWPEKPVSKSLEAKFCELLEHRIQGQPIAYLVGSRGFWSMDLQVSQDTLIPRPETELLVELALNLRLPKKSHGLDLGTGTGAVALALATERPDMNFIAVDYQVGAVSLANKNCQTLGLSNVNIFQSDWFDSLQLTDNQFDLIVSNPPYISVNDPHLQQGDVRYEPNSALVSGVDGLDDLKKIIAQSPLYLKSDGWLLLEHGFDQGPAVVRLMIEAGFQEVVTHKDYNQIDRVTLGQWA
ncbi:peptide chain release factor N(5)-glutamine methyltransferase [Porticoccaceae bacterium]|jgi:release factor glutamine methyltransferase|nr:peptide chain release factor N(5)-glutamine methyltransferase [Porticoccaceae bacterium]